MEEIDLRELFEYFKGKILWIIAAIILAIGVGNVGWWRKLSHVFGSSWAFLYE